MRLKYGKASSSLSFNVVGEVELNTLEELLDWVKSIGEDVIILHNNEEPKLLIYDDYIE